MDSKQISRIASEQRVAPSWSSGWTARALVAAAALAVLALLVWALPSELVAQAAQNTPGPPREMRQFWHVFIAYAIAWILVFVWLVTILRRIRRVDERLTKLEERK